MLKGGVLDGLSIGFHTREAREGTGALEGVRILDDVDLWEISIVTFPMNEKSRILDHKQYYLLQDIHELNEKIKQASNDNRTQSARIRRG